MKTVILVLAVAALVEGQKYQYSTDSEVKDDSFEDAAEIIPNSYQGTSTFLGVSETTIPVYVQQEAQQQFSSIPNDNVPQELTSNYRTNSFTTATEPTVQYFEQDSSYNSKSSSVPDNNLYQSRRNEVRNSRRRGSSRFSATSAPQPNLNYVRSEPQQYRYPSNENQYNSQNYYTESTLTTTERNNRRFSTSNYYTESVPTTTEPNTYFSRQPNSVQEHNLKQSYNEGDKSVHLPSKSQRQEEIRRRNSRRNPEGDAYILRYSNENNVYNGYKFGYETSNGIQRNEELVFDNPENIEQPTIHGGYEFTDPSGIRVIVTYTAGIHGFRPIIKYIE